MNLKPRNKQICLIGPPLLNLSSYLRESKFWVDGKPQEQAPLWCERYNMSESFIAPPVAAAQKLQFVNPLHKDFSGALKIQPSHCGMFAGKKVVLLLSKNTHLIWLRDLVEFNVKIHGANAVLLYDNASTAYDVQDILETISQVEGVEASAVVPWNFPYGALGGPEEIWDSDYAQYGIIEHARLRFLQTCEAVLYTDADELLVPNTDKSLFEVVAASRSGAVAYNSHLMHSVGVSPEDSLLRFKDLVYAEREPHALRRWTAVPSRIPLAAQMTVHFISGHEVRDVSQDFHFRHFFPLTVHPEKQDRRLPVPFDESLHYKDEALIAAMKKVGWL